MIKRTSFIFALLLIGIASYSQTSQSDFSFKQPEDTTALKKVTLWSTQYFIHAFQSGGTIPIVYQDGKNSGLYADTCHFCEASLEGTAYITDSAGNVTTVNYATTGTKVFVDCRKCKKYSKSKLAVESWGKTLWSKSKGFGDGVKNFKLVPFRTIAVDSKVIPFGSVIYIPKVKGKTITLPNGQKVLHDGYFFAGDTGGAIKGNHVDTFTGVYTGNPFTEVIKSNEKKTFEAYLVTSKEIVTSLSLTQTK